MRIRIVPGGAKKFLTRGQASYLLRTAPTPVGIVAQTRHSLARELKADQGGRLAARPHHVGRLDLAQAEDIRLSDRRAGTRT